MIDVFLINDHRLMLAFWYVTKILTNRLAICCQNKELHI